MVAAVVILSAYALSLSALILVRRLHKVIDDAIRDAFSGLSTEDLMFDYRPYHYEGYLRTSPLAEAEAQIKANLARSKK